MPARRVALSRSRRATFALVAVASAAPCSTTPLASQEHFWIGRIGVDTAFVEASIRSGDRLSGTIVNVAAGLVLQRYEVALDVDGNVRSLRVWEGSWKNGAPVMDVEPTLWAEVGADSVRVSRAGWLQASPAVRGVVPLLDALFHHPIALMELALRQATARPDGVARMLLAGSVDPVELVVRSEGGDTVSVPYVLAERYPMLAGARLRAVMDAEGLVELDARETTFKIVTRRESAVDPVGFARRLGARGVGGDGLATLSPSRRATGRIGILEIAVSYGQPRRRGRHVFPDVVPFGRVWRAGANAATRISFSADALVEGVSVPAGAYSLWIVPGSSVDTLILNRTDVTWGTSYDVAQDLLRVQIRRAPTDDPIEALTYEILSDSTGMTGVVTVAWDDRRFMFNVGVAPPMIRPDRPPSPVEWAAGWARLRERHPDLYR